jgi:enamine deaminase RidA (YjgF/YER057c/UK114 family)
MPGTLRCQDWHHRRHDHPRANRSVSAERRGELRAAGSSLDKAVQATFIPGEEADFPGMNEEWAKWFPKDPPARPGAKLPVHPQGMRVSIALVAEA